MKSTMTQLNVRIDANLKQAGDAALADIGFSPSEAVRALWARAAKRGEDAQQVHAILTGEPAVIQPVGEALEAAIEPEVRKRLELLESHRKQAQEVMNQLGIGNRPRPSSMPADRDLYLEALDGRMSERGLA